MGRIYHNLDAVHARDATKPARFPFPYLLHGQEKVEIGLHTWPSYCSAPSSSRIHTVVLDNPAATPWEVAATKA